MPSSRCSQQRRAYAAEAGRDLVAQPLFESIKGYDLRDPTCPPVAVLRG